MNDESRPSGPAHETPAKKSGHILTPLPDSAPLFDVVSVGGSTRYKPSVEMASVIDTAGRFWQATARQDVLAWLETHDTVSSDDPELRELIPEPTNPSAWGALFSSMATAGELEFVAYRKSRRRSAHSRVVAVWSRRRAR